MLMMLRTTLNLGEKISTSMVFNAQVTVEMTFAMLEYSQRNSNNWRACKEQANHWWSLRQKTERDNVYQKYKHQ